MALTNIPASAFNLEYGAESTGCVFYASRSIYDMHTCNTYQVVIPAVEASTNILYAACEHEYCSFLKISSTEDAVTFYPVAETTVVAVAYEPVVEVPAAAEMTSQLTVEVPAAVEPGVAGPSQRQNDNGEESEEEEEEEEEDEDEDEDEDEEDQDDRRIAT